MQDDEKTKSNFFWLNPYQLKYDHRWTRVAADFVSSLVNQEAITVAVGVEVQVCVVVVVVFSESDISCYNIAFNGKPEA